LENKALPNIQESSISKATPLHHAVGADCGKCINNLIHNGASLKVKDSKGFNSFHSAIIAGHPRSCEILI
jgi:hypothetical protein